MADDGSNESSTTWPLPKFSFSVDIADVVTGLRFQEVSGLDAETQVIEYRSGNSKIFSAAKMPGFVKYSDVTLKKGVVAVDDKLRSLLFERNLNLIKRSEVTIKLLDEQGKPTMVWTLANAYPTKIRMTDMKADASEVLVDSIIFAHEGLTIVDK